MVARRAILSTAAGLALALGGCTNIGAARLGIDRSDYANHLRETNKEQLLLNIVAMRYGDSPLFLEVSSVISQYTREGSLHADAEIKPPAGDAKGGVGGSILLRETPTITYTPLAGERFARNLLSPISPASLLGMLESGWSVDPLFRLAVRSINGVSNGGREPLFAHRADTDFVEVIGAMDRLQRDGGLAIHIERDKDKDGKFMASGQIAEALTERDRADLALLRKRFKLPGTGGQLQISFGNAQTAPNQLAIGTRSMFEIITEMAQGVDVPADEKGRAMPPEPGTEADVPLIHIRSGTSQPADAHVAVHYRGRWFWIDGGDVESKRMFLIVQILQSLNDTSGGANAPLVTIPTG